MLNTLASIFAGNVDTVEAQHLRVGDVIIGLPASGHPRKVLSVPATRVDHVNDECEDRRFVWISSTDLASEHRDAGRDNRWSRYVVMRVTETWRSDCGCCNPPRPAHVDATFSDREEWAHDDDGIFAEVRHVHLSYESRDCDGRMSGSQVIKISDIVREALVHFSQGPDARPTFEDLWRYMVASEAPTWGGTMEVVTDPDERTSRAHIGVPTDEGGRSVELHSCRDHWCLFERDTYRDHAAEAMGY